jgi:hypothetical protein
MMSLPTSALGGEAVSPPADSAAPTLVFGFLGGFVGHNDTRHPGVKFVQRLGQEHQENIDARIFENRRSRDAYKIIRERLDANHDGVLSEAEKQPARIFLFGNSWGGSAVVSLARRLNEDGIPVLLTVQVDSVAKIGSNDSVIPANVHQAVNYYQTHGWVRGRRKITAADPSRTRILGNFLLTYDKAPVECQGFPWYDNIVTKTHVETECDPKVWSDIEGLIRRQLPTPAIEPVNSGPESHAPATADNSTVSHRD